MSIEIEIDQNAFGKLEDKSSHTKDEFKKFNMKLHNLDLSLIDAVAKRDGLSRVSIINQLIERILTDFIQSRKDDVSLLLTDFADNFSESSQLSNKKINWSLWFIEQQMEEYSFGHLENNIHRYNQEKENGNLNPDLMSVFELLQKSQPDFINSKLNPIN